MTQTALISGIILLAGLIWARKTQRLDNKYLIVLISVVCLGLLGKLLASRFYQTVPQIFLAADVFIFLLGPLVYLSLNDPRWRRSLVHGLPAGLYLLFVAYLSTKGTSKLLEELVSDSIVNLTVIPVIYFLATVQTVIYMGAAFIYMRQSRSINRQIPTLLIGALLLVNIFCLTHFLPYLGINHPLVAISPDMAWLAMVLMIYALTLYFISGAHWPALQPRKTNHKAVPVSVNAIDISEQMEALISSQHPHHNANLTLSHMADLLGVHKTMLSQVLNAHMQVTFYDYINEKRIRDFVEAVHHNRFQNLTYYGIAQEVGFKSKATFYKAFKTTFGTTPGTYFKKNIEDMVSQA